MGRAHAHFDDSRYRAGGLSRARLQGIADLARESATPPYHDQRDFTLHQSCHLYVFHAHVHTRGCHAPFGRQRAFHHNIVLQQECGPTTRTPCERGTPQRQLHLDCPQSQRASVLGQFACQHCCRGGRHCLRIVFMPTSATGFSHFAYLSRGPQLHEACVPGIAIRQCPQAQQFLYATR